MLNTKKAVFGLMAFVICFGLIMPGYAADKDTSAANKDKQTAAPAKARAPITIEGDELSFSDLTGQVFAKGNVIVTQPDMKLTTELLEGNTKQSLVWTDRPVTLTQPGIKLDGSGGIKFNYKDSTGTLQEAKGKVDRQFVTAHNLQMISSSEIILHDGTMTACPAKVPDYHVSATKVEIWPGDKLIAYNAKFWIKDKVIYSMPKYQKSLRKDAGESEFPRVGYDSDDGVFLKQYLEYPLSPRIAAFANIDYYTKAGFKPSYGVIDRESSYTLSLTQGQFEDDDNNWIKKEPEFKLDYHSRRLGSLPVHYTFSAVYGKWTDDYKTSWHQDYKLYLSGDPIKLSDTMKLYLGTGFEKIFESYDSSDRDVLRYDATLTKQFSPRFSAWTAYHYIKNNTGIFDYNTDDLGREFDVGFSYKIDRLNAISYRQSYDVANSRIYDQDYTWHRNLHCWQADITYRAKRNQLKWDISVTRW